MKDCRRPVLRSRLKWLRMIGGFIAPSEGHVEIGGADVTRLGPERRPANMVLQGFGWFPHMNVSQNVGYGPRIAKVERSEIELAARLCNVESAT